MEELIIDASMENFETLNDFVITCAKMAGLSDDSVSKLLLATEEIFVNIVNYAYEENNGSEIQIICEYKTNCSIKLKFIDQGREFNPLDEKEPDVTAPVEKRRIGGLGIFLIKKLVDSISYERAGQCNILTLVKSKE